MSKAEGKQSEKKSERPITDRKSKNSSLEEWND